MITKRNKFIISNKLIINIYINKQKQKSLTITKRKTGKSKR
jgi:hypothetical protein